MKLKISLVAAVLWAAFLLPLAAAQNNPDPCVTQTKLTLNINIAANTKLLSGTSGLKFYVCHVFIAPVGTATNIGFATGTGSTCGTGTAGFITGGDGTAAKGANLAVNEGWIQGNGAASVASTAAGVDFCLNVSAANQISGTIQYVIAP